MHEGARIGTFAYHVGRVELKLQLRFPFVIAQLEGREILQFVKLSLSLIASHSDGTPSLLLRILQTAQQGLFLCLEVFAFPWRIGKPADPHACSGWRRLDSNSLPAHCTSGVPVLRTKALVASFRVGLNVWSMPQRAARAQAPQRLCHLAHSCQDLLSEGASIVKLS